MAFSIIGLIVTLTKNDIPNNATWQMTLSIIGLIVTLAIMTLSISIKHLYT